MSAETMGPTRFQLLLDRIRELEERVCQLEADPVIDFNAPDNTPAECAARTCSFFEFYQAQAPPELTHEDFHAAERECRRVHGEMEAWLEWHQGDSQPVPLQMIRQCKAWEEAVRA